MLDLDIGKCGEWCGAIITEFVYDFHFLISTFGWSLKSVNYTENAAIHLYSDERQLYLIVIFISMPERTNSPLLAKREAFALA